MMNLIITKLTGLLPKIISEIIYHNPGTQLWNHALVLGKTGKSTSRCMTWLKVKNLKDNSLQRVNLSNMKGWKIIVEEVCNKSQ